METGRPTSYRPEYCEMLIEHMSQGLSFESFAGVVSVCKQTIYNWLENNKEFLDAKRSGTQKCLLMWEKLGIRQAATGKGSFGSFRFNMMNRFGWSDKNEVEHTGEGSAVKVTFTTDEHKPS